MAVRGVFTNTVPIDAYRGAGKPEANYLIERLVDRAARQLSLDPVALRRRNLISRFPYRSELGVTIDSGRFAANLDKMARRVLRDGFAARRRAAAARGKPRGLGIAFFLETSRGCWRRAAPDRRPRGSCPAVAWPCVGSVAGRAPRPRPRTARTRIGRSSGARVDTR